MLCEPDGPMEVEIKKRSFCLKETLRSDCAIVPLMLCLPTCPRRTSEAKVLTGFPRPTAALPTSKLPLQTKVTRKRQSVFS